MVHAAPETNNGVFKSRQTVASGYRADIDGLRALAIIPVCCFHAGLPVFSGGFVGVDIFFVISGYLMAVMISHDLSRGDFSFANFYERRIRRIFPALFMVLIFIACIASVLVTPKLFRDFGYTLVATIMFASNVAFSHKSANYFDAPTELNPLLHTWSLAVEEQFYILFPVILAMLWRFERRIVFILLAGVALASLILSIWGTANAPTATFYLLPMRAWELLVGALVALWPVSALAAETGGVPRSWVGKCAGLLGMALVLGSLIFFDDEMAFPGAAALVPCLGAALLIYFGRDSSNPMARLLSLAPLIFIGKISYSLYLWHWPLIVFAEKYHPFGQPSLALKAIVILISVCAGYASWRWVEQPFRGRGAALSSMGVYRAAITGMLLLGLVGVFAQLSNGWPGRFPGIAAVAIERQIMAERSDPDWQKLDHSKCFVGNLSAWGEDLCFLSRHAQDKTLLWGDSFAARYAYGLFANKMDFDVLQYTTPACPPITGYYAASQPQCASFNKEVADIIKRFGISTVIMAANWSSYVKRKKMRLEDIGKTVDFLHGLGVRVVLVGQSPVFGFAYPDEYFYSVYGALQADRPYQAPLAIDPKINSKISALANSDVFFDPMALLCRSAECLFKDGALYLFADYGHFTMAGSTRMVASLLAQLKK
jgi:peptidoglycan/LPS O-acetylase OafA/YrhL